MNGEQTANRFAVDKIEESGMTAYYTSEASLLGLSLKQYLVILGLLESNAPYEKIQQNPTLVDAFCTVAAQRMLEGAILLQDFITNYPALKLKIESKIVEQENQRSGLRVLEAIADTMEMVRDLSHLTPEQMNVNAQALLSVASNLNLPQNLITTLLENRGVIRKVS